MLRDTSQQRPVGRDFRVQLRLVPCRSVACWLYSLQRWTIRGLQGTDLRSRSDESRVSLEGQFWIGEVDFSLDVSGYIDLQLCSSNYLHILGWNWPMIVDIPQWGTVGVNSTVTELWASSICSADTTLSCSSDRGCSGSDIERMRSTKNVSSDLQEWLEHTKDLLLVNGLLFHPNILLRLFIPVQPYSIHPFTRSFSNRCVTRSENSRICVYERAHSHGDKVRNPYQLVETHHHHSQRRWQRLRLFRWPNCL